MEDYQNCKFATQQIHAGGLEDQYHALAMPIYMTSTFGEYDPPEGEMKFEYSRTTNPTVVKVQRKLAMLEKGEASLACCSGMGAITTALWTTLNAGDEVICNDTVYGCAYKFFKEEASRFGVKSCFVNMCDLEQIKAHLTAKTKIVYFETPCNPTLKIIDIKAVADLVHNYRSDILVFVDNTFASPYVQQPLTLGADVVFHSATKFIGGHGDTLAGFVVGKKDLIDTFVNKGIKLLTGACLSPMNAFLIDRSLKTLDIRMEKHCRNAFKLASYLEQHPAVNKVNYPGLESFPYHEVAKKQMHLFGGMIAVDFKGDRYEVREALKRLKLATFGISLGDAETLIEHPATMTHRSYTPEDMKAVGISEGLCRLSVGLEDIDDLIADFDQAISPLVNK